MTMHEIRQALVAGSATDEQATKFAFELIVLLLCTLTECADGAGDPDGSIRRELIKRNNARSELVRSCLPVFDRGYPGCATAIRHALRVAGYAEGLIIPALLHGPTPPPQEIEADAAALKRFRERLGLPPRRLVLDED